MSILETLERIAGTSGTSRNVSHVPAKPLQNKGRTSGTSGTAQSVEGESRSNIRAASISRAAPQENIDERAANDAPLPARVRQRFRDCCTRLGIESEPIMRQFDYWKYTARDLKDMDAWPDEIIETHTRLLYAEVTDGLP